MSTLVRPLRSSLQEYLVARKSIISRYALPFLITIITCYVVYLIRESENVLISSSILAATVFAAVHGGFGPAIVSTVVSTIFNELWLLESATAWPNTYAGYIRIAVYLVVSLGVSLLVSLLRQSLHTSDVMRRNAEAVNREKDAILSVVAHDLKNPIGCAMGFVEVMLDPAALNLAPATREKYLATIHRSCRLSIDIINDLQNFASLGSYQPILNMESVSLVDELSTIVASNEARARKKQITLQTNFPERYIFVDTDLKLLNRAIQNLLENAIKYSPFHSCVLVSCRRAAAGKSVEIQVQDQGPGIAEEDYDKIFEPFYKTANKPTGGESSTGLGLPSVKTIGDLLGMQVRVNSGVGRGSTFTLTLPAQNAKSGRGGFAHEAAVAKPQLGPV